MPTSLPDLRSYLHEPVRNESTIVEYLHQKQPEGEQLDFKSIPWIKGESLETAKDIAAFANHLGGDIIIGIADKADCANGLNPMHNAELPKIRHQIHQALINHIRPVEFAEQIDFGEIQTSTPDHSVLVVSIPPSPELISVEEKASDKSFFQFPIRTGRRTRSLTYEEVMERTLITTRATYLKLKRISTIGSDSVRFSTPVLVIAGDFLVPLPVHKNNTKMHGTLEALSLESIIVTMSGASKPVNAKRVLDNGVIVNDNNPIQVVENRSLVIPLELIKAVWRDLAETNYLFFALDASIVWDNNSWLLSLGDISRRRL